MHENNKNLKSRNKKILQGLKDDSKTSDFGSINRDIYQDKE